MINPKGLLQGTGHNGGPPLDDPFHGYSELRPVFKIKYSRVHLLRLMKAGKFPPAYQLSANRIGWRRSQLLEYLANRPIAHSISPHLTSVTDKTTSNAKVPEREKPPCR
jgi:predicted DNA-binding transcriptional regulator AlpA